MSSGHRRKPKTNQNTVEGKKTVKEKSNNSGVPQRCVSLEACAHFRAGHSSGITVSSNNSACNHSLKSKLVLFNYTLWEEYAVYMIYTFFRSTIWHDMVKKCDCYIFTCGFHSKYRATAVHHMARFCLPKSKFLKGTACD